MTPHATWEAVLEPFIRDAVTRFRRDKDEHIVNMAMNHLKPGPQFIVPATSLAFDILHRVRGNGTYASPDEDDDINAAIGDAETPQIVLPSAINVEAFRGPIGAFAVDTGWQATLASPVALLVTGLAAYGALAGRAAWYRWGSAYGYATIFATMIGPTGQGAKGISRRVTDRYMKPVPGHHVLSHLSSGEGFVKAVANLAPGDVVEDRRTLVITEEISALLRAKDRESNTLGQYLIEAYDGVDLQRHTVREQVTAENPAISVVGHVTPEVLLKELKEIDIANGFINRFLLLPSMSRWRDGLIDRPQAVYDDLATTLTNRLTTIRDKINVGPMRFTPEALDLLAACDRWQFAEAPLLRPPTVAQMLQRLAQNTWRMSVAYALSEARRQVEADDVHAAIAVADLSERTVRALFTTSQPLTDDEDSILNWMVNKGRPSYTAAEVTHGAVSSRYRDRAKRALPGLVAKGRVESSRSGRGTRFSVVSAGGQVLGRSMREAVRASGM